VAKLAVGEYLRYYRDVHGLRSTVLALANVYGPRQDLRGEAGVVAIFSRQLLAREPCTIYGDGTQTRDFVYVDDVVDAFGRAASTTAAEVELPLANVGTGVETSVKRLYALMARLAGVREEPQFASSRPGELVRSALDPTLLGTVLGWKPATSLEQGVAKTLDWFRDELA
jgi:UDP-glucose 4-epimerase